MNPSADTNSLSYKLHGESDPQVVFVHGWAMSSGVFAEQAEMLKSSYSVLLPDLPGHGLSAPSPQKLTLKACAEKLAQLVEKLGIGETHLAGWSLGGQVACMVSLLLPKGRVKSITIIDGTPRHVAPCKDDPTGVPATKAKWLRRAIEKDFPDGIKDFAETFFAGEDISPDRKVKVENLLFANFPPDKDSVLDLLDDYLKNDIRPILPRIDVPCLICYGRHDRITPVESSKLWEGLSSESQKTLFDGCAHAPFLTRPVEFNETLRKFLSGLNK